MRRYEILTRDGRFVGVLYAKDLRAARAQARRVGPVRGWPARLTVRPYRRLSAAGTIRRGGAA